MRRFAPIPVKHAPNDDNIAAGLSVVDWDAIVKLIISPYGSQLIIKLGTRFNQTPWRWLNGES